MDTEQNENQAMKNMYELYCKYCKQLHMQPCKFQEFHKPLYEQTKILAHSYYGYNKQHKL